MILLGMIQKKKPVARFTRLRVLFFFRPFESELSKP
jgi:hypothetical protein